MFDFDKHSKIVTTIVIFFYILGGISLLSWPFNTSEFVTLMSVISIQCLGYIIFILRPSIPKKNIVFLVLVVTGLVLRVITFYTEALLEDDYNCYLWDGRVLNNGINPYMFAPDSPELDHLHTDYRENIGFLNIKTIYPPVAQYIFGFAHWVFGDSILGLKFIFAIFELSLSAVVYKYLGHLKDRRFLFLVYFLNPLLIFQVYNGLHLDIAAIFFVFVAFWAFQRLRDSKKKSMIVAGLIALGFQVKVFPLVIMPIFFKVNKNRILFLATFIGATLLLFAPFLSAGADLLSGFGAFSREWVFNASVFGLLSFLGGLLGIEDQWVRAVVALLYVPFFTIIFFRLKQNDQLLRSILLAVYVLLLLSPVFNAWYLMWILPFAVLSREWIIVIHSFLIFLGYSWFEFPALYPYLVGLEYGLLLVAAVILHRKRVLFRGVIS